MYQYWKYPDVPISDLVGKNIVEIYGMTEDSESIAIICSDGSKYMMYHMQVCCEHVRLLDVCGDVSRLLNNPILKAEERISNDNPLDPSDAEWGSFTWTFYTLATVRGYVDLRWYGTSNGYYSESVTITKIQ